MNSASFGLESNIVSTSKRIFQYFSITLEDLFSKIKRKESKFVALLVIYLNLLYFYIGNCSRNLFIQN